MINVFFDDKNEYYKFGLLGLLHEVIERHTDQKIHLLGSGQKLSRADIIIRAYPAGAETLCHPELIERKPGSLLVGIYDGDIQTLNSSLMPHCFDNAIFIHRTEPTKRLVNRILFAWMRAKMKIDGKTGCRKGCRDCKSVELSLQEIKIISYISQGFTIARIANILDLSVKTVSAHKRRVMRKFNIKSNVELITLCKVTLQITNQSKVCFIP